MGQRTFRFGENPSDANLVKLSGNFLISSVIEALGEAMALVGKAGLDQHQYLDFLTSTLFNAPVYKTYGGLIADKKFEPAGFAAPLGFKDNRLVLAAAETLQVPLAAGQPDLQPVPDFAGSRRRSARLVSHLSAGCGRCRRGAPSCLETGLQAEGVTARRRDGVAGE